VACLFGTQGQPATTYRSAYTPKSLRELLCRSGFGPVNIVNRKQAPEQGRFEFEIEAYKAA
jgi:hypothetical protein